MHLRNGCAANSYHTTKVNRYITLFVYTTISSIILYQNALCAVAQIFFVFEGGLQSLNVRKLNRFYSYQYSDKFLLIQ